MGNVLKGLLMVVGVLFAFGIIGTMFEDADAEEDSPEETAETEAAPEVDPVEYQLAFHDGSTVSILIPRIINADEAEATARAIRDERDNVETVFMDLPTMLGEDLSYAIAAFDEDWDILIQEQHVPDGLPEGNELRSLYEAEAEQHFERLERERAEAERREMIEQQFSSWDGSHRQFVREVKRVMHDDSSFDHIETRYRDDEDTIFLIMEFRGTNAFGATVRNTAYGRADVRSAEILELDIE